MDLTLKIGKPKSDIDGELLKRKIIQARNFTQLLFQYGALTSPLPDNINLMSLEPWEDGRLVLRLENIFQRSEILGGGSATIDITVRIRCVTIAVSRSTE